MLDNIVFIVIFVISCALGWPLSNFLSESIGHRIFLIQFDLFDFSSFFPKMRQKLYVLGRFKVNCGAFWQFWQFTSCCVEFSLLGHLTI